LGALGDSLIGLVVGMILLT